ncbi:rai1 protein [Amniculicola lignicola CBS 123094]|uniref:Decapping nuclease n=1 Tax=Amniculicola lignicola CBS 123094 TaxID=1392246 RepID=A0A6A5WS23_9PLEO|nr:rai1 protein [Amniculicola lignicola CBS 123094]
MEANSVPERDPPHPLRFEIRGLQRFANRATNITKPREIAHYSHDEDHGYTEDESGIRYYWPTHVGVSLVEGVETWKHYEDKEDPHLEYLLKNIINKEKSTGEKIQADFVCFRGMMTNFLITPFSRFADCDMLATLHHGTIYIQENFESKRHRNKRPNLVPRPHELSQEQLQYGGYKFETLSLVSEIPSDPSTFMDRRYTETVSNYAQHCSIISTAIGSSKLILAGEVDGLSAPKTGDPSAIPWVELKTTASLSSHGFTKNRDTVAFERKLLKFWAQSYLLGVPKIIVGFRNKTGLLVRIQEFKTMEIPGIVNRSSKVWNGADCVRFTDAFLGFLKDSIKGEGVWSIKRTQDWLEVVRVEETGTGSILSQEFLDWRAGVTGKEEEKEVQREEEKEGSKGEETSREAIMMAMATE